MSRAAQEGIAERLQALKRPRPPDPAAPLPKRARVQDQQLVAFNRRVELHPQRKAAASLNPEPCRRQQYRYYKELRRMELQSPAVQGPNRSAARVADGSPAAGDVEEVNIRHHLMGVLLESPAPRIDWQADRQQQAS